MPTIRPPVLSELLAGVERRLAGMGFGLAAVGSEQATTSTRTVVVVAPPKELLGQWSWLFEYDDQRDPRTWIEALGREARALGIDRAHAISRRTFGSEVRCLADTENVGLHELEGSDHLRDSIMVLAFNLALDGHFFTAPALMVQRLSPEGLVERRDGEFIFRAQSDLELRYPARATYRTDGKFDLRLDLAKIPAHLREGTVSLFRRDMPPAAGRHCYAGFLGGCGGAIPSEEHYISKAVLDIFAGETVQVSGLPWLTGEKKTLPKKRLVANALCEAHNCWLSPIDREASAFLSVIHRCIRGGIQDLVGIDDLRLDYCGSCIEKWLLKVACGAIASGNHGGAPRYVPQEWVEVLFGRRPWPEYFQVRSSEHSQYVVPSHDHARVDFVHDGPSGRLKGVAFHFMCLDLTLPLGAFQGVPGLVRPRRLVFQTEARTVEFKLDWEDG